MLQILRACLLAALALPALGQQTPSDDVWPEWRGGSRQGFSAARSLPTRLDPGGPTMRWKVPVRGGGISSPIVVDGRVFVTTAHRYESGLLRLRSIVIVLLSAVALLAGSVLLLRRHRREARHTRRRDRWLVRIDTLVASLATCAFVGLAATANFTPDTLWTLGRPGEAWLISGTILLLGLAAATSVWTRPGRLRSVSSAALVAAGGLVWFGVPLDRHGVQHGAAERALMVAPGLVLACWSLLASSLLSLRGVAQGADRGSALRSTGGIALAGAALLLFWSVNSWDREDRLARAILCFDLETGAELWERVLLVAEKEQKWPNNSYATPTPCSDGQRVFAYFGAGWGCVDLDGNLLWTGTDPDYLPASRYGAGASPILDRGQILLWQENEMKNRRSYLLSLDFATGAVNWRVEPDDVHDSYSTPILVPRQDGTLELISMAYRKLVAHSVRDGSRLWELALPARQVVPSLCYAGDDLLLASGGTHLEFSTSGVRLHGAGVETRPEVLWQTRRNLSDVCSPVLGEGLHFTIIDGRMRCLDPRTGEIHWTGRLGSTDYWASLVAGDGKVYALSGEGEMTTLAIDASECRVLAECEFDEACMATPALVEGRVLVRTEKHLYCFGKRSEG